MIKHPVPSAAAGTFPPTGHGSLLRLLPRLLMCLPLLAVPPLAVAAVSDITQMSLEQLLDVTIVGASKYEQKQDEVAAAVSVITRSEIKAFGWRTIDEALASLPGIHTTYDRQYNYIGTRGFGLPGDFNTRVLLTINGNRVNDVVYESAVSGRAFPVDLDLIERIEFIPARRRGVWPECAVRRHQRARFYISPQIGEDELTATVGARAKGRPNWVVPALGIRSDPALLALLRRSGRRGPLWDLL